MTDMLELAEKAVKHVLRLGASHCDVLVADSRQVTAEIEKSSIKQASVITDPGVAIRAFKNGCSGFAYSTGHDLKSVKNVASLAVSQASSGTPDPDFKDLPEKSVPRSIQGLFDQKLTRIEPDDAVEMAIALSDYARSDKRIASVNAGVGIGCGTVALANSNGFGRTQKMTAFEMSAEAVAKSGTRMFSGIDGGWSRRLDTPMIGRVGSSARESAIRGLNQTRIKTGDYPVVLDPLAAGYILLTAIGGGANAESIQRKRSYLEGRLGKQIGNENLTVIDDPTLEWASGSYSFDGEGVPAKRHAIIERGLLDSYIYDSYTSGKDSVENTGNSSRGGAIWSFRRPPSISSSNIVVARGSSSFEEMVDDTRSGVYLRITYDSPNLATGEFSGLMMESFLINKGEVGPSIQQATMGIGLLDMFSCIDMVGKKTRDAFGTRTPALRISSARIAGSG